VLNLSTGELLVIAVIALVVLGPERLPGAARQAGRAIAELRKISNGFQREVQEAMREPTPTLPPLPAEAQPEPEAPKPARRRAPLQARATAEEQLLGQDQSTTEGA
jgi:sec-independent protein translocase protein TatB